MIAERKHRDNDRPIVVTGCKGYIGQYLVTHFVNLGLNVVGLSRKDCEITDSSTLLGLVGEIQPSTVYHLAGLTGVEESWRNPSKFYQVNVLGVQSVLESCRKVGARMVFLSGYLYDGEAKSPVQEESPITAMNPYAHTKWLGEKICEFFHKHYGVACIITRPFNVYGGPQSNKFLIPKLIEQAVSHSEIITVKDDAPIRDYLYIRDLISALETILDYEPEFGVFNIGTGIGHSVSEVTDMIQKIWGVKKELVSLDCPRENEISVSIADIGRIKTMLGWQPSYSLESGLREMFDNSR